jgi:hypothetical protein
VALEGISSPSNSLRNSIENNPLLDGLVSLVPWTVGGDTDRIATVLSRELKLRLGINRSEKFPGLLEFRFLGCGVLFSI